VGVFVRSRPRDFLHGQALRLDRVGLPLDRTRAAIPADNPQTPEKIALGERLFFDGRLSDANAPRHRMEARSPRPQVRKRMYDD
jgi:hypothetical protein